MGAILYVKSAPMEYNAMREGERHLLKCLSPSIYET